MDDKAESGTKSDRESFQEVLNLARSGAIFVIGVDDQARFSRGDNVVGDIRDLVFAGIRVVTGDGVDTDCENWELKCRVLGMHNATTIDELARRVRRGQRGRVLRNLSTGDFSYGYRSQFVNPELAAQYVGRGPKPERRVVIYEPEAYWVREIFRLFCRERLSFSRIARHLTTQKVSLGTKLDFFRFRTR